MTEHNENTWSGKHLWCWNRDLDPNKDYFNTKTYNEPNNANNKIYLDIFPLIRPKNQTRHKPGLMQSYPINPIVANLIRKVQKRVAIINYAERYVYQRKKRYCHYLRRLLSFDTWWDEVYRSQKSQPLHHRSVMIHDIRRFCVWWPHDVWCGVCVVTVGSNFRSRVGTVCR